MYVHCASHNLNLIPNDAVRVQEVRQFFDIVERIYVFFGHSIKRWAMLTHSDQAADKGSNHITIKKLCATRWASPYDAVSALRHRYGDVIKALARIGLKQQH